MGRCLRHEVPGGAWGFVFCVLCASVAIAFSAVSVGGRRRVVRRPPRPDSAAPIA
jgi:hypothetical protein